MSYVDVRDLHPDYRTETCPNCGEERRFKSSRWDGDTVWLCQSCNKRLTEDIEIACPECDTRMTFDGPNDRWLCQVCEAERETDKDALLERMTEGADHRVGHVIGERCPACGESGVMGDPDATAICRQCEGVYFSRYSDEWWAYAEWLSRRGYSGRYEPPTWIRINLDVNDSDKIENGENG